MSNQKHYRCLESMYAAAPINSFYDPVLEVQEGRASITIELSEKYHHAAGAVHGSVYFKMLDDAAFFAANSLEMKYFVLTTAFTTYLTRPVAEGMLRSVGEVVNSNRTQFIAESVLYDSEDNELARGNGIFVRSKLALADAAGFIG